MTTAAAYFTRADYMASKADEQTASHHRYYSQFCSPAVLSAVSSSIGADKIKASTDLHFNDILNANDRQGAPHPARSERDQ